MKVIYVYGFINRSRGEFISGNMKIYLHFLAFPQYLEGRGGWNHYTWKTRMYLSYVFKAMVVDDLATIGARSSASMVLT